MMNLFEHAINLFESFLIMLVLYFLCRRKKAGKTEYIFSFCFFLFQFSFITSINYVSMTESVFEIIELSASFFYESLISEDSAAYKFFICAIPYNIIGIENMIQNSTISYILFHKIDYYMLADQYRIINVVFSQLIHMILFYYVVRTVNKMDQTMKDQDYYLLGLIFFVCNYLTICFETLGYHFENQDLFVLLGIYLIVLFIVLIAYLFVSIYRHSMIETKQQIELDILHSQQSANRKILEAQNDLYQLRHDMKHLFQALHDPEILNDKNSFENTIGEYENLIKNTAVPVTTISAPINYVLNIKKEEAISRGIDFTSTLNIIHEIAMEDSDLYLLLSNLLDNAIEHIGMLKKIRIEMSDVEKMFKIKITNSIDHPVLDHKGNFISYSTEPEHGYGIKTINSILKKYDGFVSYAEDNNDLVATVMLHNN